ncbi:hypothetical protein P43SY_011927 [Pythium insidiosum]|uniref:Transmembrane protein n=1 Tax=Pythium insidiosum TaxID=114742 RepID=A0AAD5LS68_PYTIN|nr:hypothetical protein P43SY_011927 [Pythium insidiosum]
MPSFMRRFRHGYGAFFASVVLRNRIDYRTNSRVSRLEPFEDPVSGRQRVRVHLTAPSSPSPMAAVVSTGAPGVPKAAATTGAGASAASALPSSEFEFDAVLVTGRPDQVHHILPESHPMTPLYGEVKRHSQAVARSHGVYGVAIVSFSVSPRAGFVAQPRFVLDHQKHSRAMYADRLSAVVNMMRVIKTTDEAILTVVFQTQHEAVGTAGERELLFAELALYGFRDLHVLKMVHYPNTPTRVPVEAVAAGWYDRAEAAQGQQQLFFVGETFSGHGVPTVFLHTRDWCVRTFGLGRGGMRGLAGDVDVDGDGDMDHVGLDLEGEPDPFQPLIVNVSARLADMGTQTYMAMLRRPLEAVRLGVHPVLLVESPHDTAMPPVAFIFCLVGAMTLLHLFQHSMVTRGVEWTKKKNVAIYCTEIVVSCVALAAIVDGCTELLVGEIPADFLRSTRRALFSGMLMNSMYLCELAFHPRLRQSLRVHHVVCVALFVLMHFCFAKHKALVVLQMGVFNVMNALTEQTVFVFMLLHRVCPPVLRRWPVLGFVLTMCYAGTRVLFGSLALRACCTGRSCW